MNESSPEREQLCQLVTQFAAGQISAEELALLETMLLNDPEAQNLFRELRAQQVELRWKFGKPFPVISTDETTVPPMPRRRSPWSRTAVLVAAGLAATVALVVWWSDFGDKQANPGNPAAAAMAQMTEVVGEVVVIDKGQEGAPLQSERQVVSGQTVRTGSNDSSATVVYPDGTRLDLASDTVARLWVAPPSDGSRKHVFQSSGVVRAESPQSDNAPMIISTPHAEIRMHGAKLASSVGPSGTCVELEEGAAEVIRQADGEPIHLTKGSFAISSNTIEPLVAQSVPDAPAEPRATSKVSGTTLTYVPDASLLAVPWGPNLQLCQPETGQVTFTLTGHQRDIWHAVATGKMCVTAGPDPYLIVWDIAKREELRRLAAGPSGVRCVALATDGGMLASVDAGVKPSQVTLWEPSTGVQLRKLQVPDGEAVSVAFSPTGPLLAAALSNHRIVVWDARTGDVVRALELPKIRTRLVAFTPDGRYLLGACQDQKVRFWETTRWELAKVHATGPSECGAVTISPTGQLLALSMNDGTVELWRLVDGLPTEQVALLRKFRKRGAEFAAFSPDSRTLATTRPWEAVKLWDVSGMAK
jgi:WD40 repeat protein